MEDLPGLKSAIATVLRRVRREARLSQQKLADFAGLSRIHIAQLEGRRQNATLNALLLRECPAYTLLYQFSPKDTGQSKVK